MHSPLFLCLFTLSVYAGQKDHPSFVEQCKGFLLVIATSPLGGSLVGTVMSVGDAVACQPFENLKNNAQKASVTGMRALWLLTRQVVREQGVWRACFRGTGESFLLGVPITVTQVGLHGFFKEVCDAPDGRATTAFSAAAAGATSALLVAPRDMIVQKKGIEGMPMSTLIRSIIHEQGVRGLFRALGPVAVREAGGAFGYLALADMLRCQAREFIGYDTPYTSVGSAAAAGMLMAMVTHPADTVRNVLQDDYARKTYRSSWEAARRLYAQGAKTFFAGLPPRVALVAMSTIALDQTRLAVLDFLGLES